jgi:glycosyltransferase involved in cell wall biosynthesis
MLKWHGPPKVTVLMAVHNGERYLRESVESILAQTFDDFEFLIVNDGSTDRTRELIRSYDDTRLRLVDNEQNLGQTRSLNRGLRLATGEFIARQDADDVSEPQRLAKQVAFLESDPNLALLGTWYKEIGANGAVMGERELPCFNTDIRWCLLFFCPFVHSSVMFRKSMVLDHIGFYNEAFTYSQDYELWHRIARWFPVANLPEHLMRLRTHPFSMTATYGDRVQEGWKIRITNIEYLLGWDKSAPAESNESRFRTMSSLFFGHETDFSAHAVEDATQEILRLQTAFSLTYGMDRKERRIHRAKVCSRVSWRLLDNARASVRRGNYVGAGRFVFHACRLYAPALFENRFTVPLPINVRR